jgi:toxin ParE1/3/4
MKLVLTEAALEDLRSIRTYTLETWGPEQEQRYLRQMWLRLETIGSEPDRYRLREDLFPGCRLASEGRHVILFRAMPNVLEIVRVLHSSMDYKRHLPPL